MKISVLKSFKRRPVFFLLLIFLGILPFLDGGTHAVARVLILIFPLPLFLIGIASGEIKFKRLPKWLTFFWWAFLFFVTLSVVGSTSLIFSIPEFFQLLAIFLFFNLFLLVSNKETLKEVVWLVFAVSFIFCLLSLHYLLPWAGRPAPMNLVYATYGHSHLADYLLLAVPLALALFLGAKTTRKAKMIDTKLLFGGLLIFYLISFVFTFSRGAFLVLPAVIFLLVLFLKPQTLSKRLISWLLVLIPLGLLLIILIFSLSPLGAEKKLADPRHWLIKQLVKPEFQAKRLDYWQQALEGFRARPLFGFGWGTFEIVALRFQRANFDWSSFTHNFYLQVLAEAGIFAFLSFLGFLLVSFDYLWRLVKRHLDNPLLLGGFGAILASSLHSFLDFDWHFPAIFLTFLFLLANLLSLSLLFRGGIPVPPLRWKKIYQGGLIFLAFLVYVFGSTQVVGEYFYFKKDYQKALLFSPWPAQRVRRIGDKIFEKDFVEGEKTALRNVSLSQEDPSMYSWLADKYFGESQLEKASENYQKAIIFDPLGNYRLYPKLGEIYAQLGKEEKKDELYQFFRQKLEKTKAYSKDDNRLAKIFYSIGEDYLERGEVQETIFWWERAVRATPQWSYFHIELANLYLSLSEMDQAKAVLTNCLNFYFPKIHCQEYLDRLSNNQEFEPPGFWRDKILAIPDF